MDPRDVYRNNVYQRSSPFDVRRNAMAHYVKGKAWLTAGQMKNAVRRQYGKSKG
ncbi:hypothetical protein ACFL0V_04665 [Nanoarchaeota archaeon]